jgi:signal transduction histidine kinase
MRQKRKSALRGSSARVHRIVSRHVPTILVVVLLLGEAGVGGFIIRDLTTSYATVQKMYNGSVQGLLRFGDLQYRAQETRRSTLYALTTNDGNLQVEYADQSRRADRAVTEGIAQYLADARTQQEAHAGRQLAADWNAYLQVRDDVLGRILESTPKEAVQVDLTRGVPLFERVRQDLDEIKRIYDLQASEQVATVRHLLNGSTTRLLTALTFGLLFGAISVWAIQKTRMRTAVELAELQMEFVASVSHELRTPITAILSAAENLRDGLVTKREDIVEQSTVITDQAVQLGDLVDQVLSFSSTATASHVHPLGEIHVEEIIEDALRSTKTLLADARFSVDKQIQPDLPNLVGDFSVLTQCLQNLIINAVKYSPENKWICISAKMDEFRNEVQIRVHDRGVGISSSDLLHIFEPFYRSPQAVTAHIKGTGLGLSIAKRSAEALGGSLTVSSELGMGSVFTLSLPAVCHSSAAIRFAEASRAGSRP